MLSRRISSRRTFWALADIAAEGVLAGAEVLLTLAVRPAAVRVRRTVVRLHAASQAHLRHTQRLTSQSISRGWALQTLRLDMDTAYVSDTPQLILIHSIYSCQSLLLRIAGANFAHHRAADQ